MERARRNRARGGGRSSGEVGFDATVHGRKSWWWLRVPGAALSTVRRSVVSLHGCGHGCAMAGGEKLSAAVENGARGRAQAREKRGKEEELTAESERGSTSSGRSWRRRIDRRWLGCPRLKTRAKAAMQGLRRCVARWGGRGSRGRANGLVGGAREWLYMVAATAIGGEVRARPSREREREGDEGESERG